MIRLRDIGVIFILCIFLGGCGHYYLGNPCVRNLPFRCLYVKPVDNASMAPQVHALVTEQVMRALHQSDVETVCCEGQADASLVVVVVDYKKTKATSLESDTELASSFWIELGAVVSLVNNETGCYYFKDQYISVSINGLSDVSLQSINYQDMPVLTQKLSQRIRDLVVDTW